MLRHAESEAGLFDTRPAKNLRCHTVWLAGYDGPPKAPIAPWLAGVLYTGVCDQLRPMPTEDADGKRLLEVSSDSLPCGLGL
jgi:hypothetical protein